MSVCPRERKSGHAFEVGDPAQPLCLGIAAEVFALRHPLAVLRQRAPVRLRLGRVGRLVWVLLSRVWTGWRETAPIPRATQPPSAGRIVQIPEVGGLHHHYERRAT